ncbi:hypothetical protein ACFU9Y_34555 [Streptomyces sp. NPDC057621]|uniref:hypothetical protein n=1 Tax=Streptomyces sp. NPDC057621 TaxID=3346186 RepID=UPI0036BE7A0B
MTAAVIAASASILVAVLAFVFNQYAQVHHERRQAKLARVNSQLRELYGPLNSLVDVNERIWETLRESSLPTQAERSPEAATPDWTRWRDHALMPANRRMFDLIIEHADLILESDFPAPLREFCAHVVSMDVVFAAEADGHVRRALIGHPGAAYVDYVRESFLRLKREQRHILRR